MQRKAFIATLLGVSASTYMDGFSSVVNALAASRPESPSPDLFATFGAVHLNVTSLEKATWFWTTIAGMQVRSTSGTMAEFGTESQSLIVVHQTATQPYQEGFSGLYHVAVHAPNREEFARMLYRVLVNNYPCSPTDHTMSQSVYLTDPDGITIEFALETPERFRRVITAGGLRMEATDGTTRPASAVLDVAGVLSALPDKDTRRPLAAETRIGHIHLYVNHVEKADRFYKSIGFQQFNFLPQYQYADVGAGGPYQHRIAMNAWHGLNRPLAPLGSAGLRHFQIIYQSKDRLNEALRNLSGWQEQDGCFQVTDPTGNTVLLTHG